jgi:hypothetical protein
MAYPTNVNFKGTGATVGGQAASTAQTTQTAQLGTTSRATDATRGEGEFIYLAGVAGTLPGDLVSYDPVAGTTTRAVAATRGPLAVAMAATGAGSFGLYQIRGYAIVSTAAAAINAPLYLSATPGQATGTLAAGQRIDNAIAKTAQDAPGAGFTGVYITYPSANGT